MALRYASERGRWRGEWGWMGWALCDNIFMATCVLLKAWYKAQRINNWSPINPSCLILFDQTNTETHTHTRHEGAPCTSVSLISPAVDLVYSKRVDYSSPSPCNPAQWWGRVLKSLGIARWAGMRSTYQPVVLLLSLQLRLSKLSQQTGAMSPQISQFQSCIKA